MSDTKLSVVIPTYRRDVSLARALTALAQQDLAQIEIIVVDQNPRGFLEARIAESLHSVVHLQRDEANASAARNAGFNIAKGRYVLFMDDDLVPSSRFCRNAIETMERHPEIGCLCPLIVSGSGRREATRAALPSRKRQHPEEPALWEVRETISAAVFFDSAFFRRTGGFDEGLFRYARTAEDQELFLRMGARGLSIWLATHLSVFHDEHVAGGCELRSSDYWLTRKRCTQSWVLRARLHNAQPGSLSARDLLKLSRSSFLNRQVLREARSTLRNAWLLASAVRESGRFVRPYLPNYPGVLTVDHLGASVQNAPR